jgi:hypothetical protein
MNEAAPQILQAIEGSAFAAGIRQSPYAYMVANVAHILSLAIFAGAVAIMDTRMAGALRATAPGEVLRLARRFALLGFAGLVLSGSVLFAAEASHVALNPVFQIKVALIVLGLANVIYFELALAPKVRRIKPLKDLPQEVRASGIASLVLWLCVAACGRLIAYF